MSEPQFTQDEWEAVESDAYGPEVQANGEDIAWIVSGNPADLYLIAAAPRLYKALAVIVSAHDREAGAGSGFLSADEIAAARAALGAARGEETE